MLNKKVKSSISTRPIVLRFISENVPFAKIAKYQKVTVTAIYQMYYRLQKAGLITSDKILTPIGLDMLNNVKKTAVLCQNVKPNSARGHFIQFTINLRKIPRDWEKRRGDIMQLEKYQPNEWWTVGGKQQEFRLGKVRVRLTTKSVVIYVKNVYADDPRLANTKAQEIMYSMLPKINNLLKLKLGKANQQGTKIRAQHHALLKNKFADDQVAKNQTFEVYDRDNKLRLLVDVSHTELGPEFEAVNSIHAEEDGVASQRFFKDSPREEVMLDIIEKPHYLLSELSKIASTTLLHQEHQSSLVSEAFELGKSNLKQIKALIVSQADTTKLLKSILEASSPPKPKEKKEEENSGEPAAYIG